MKKLAIVSSFDESCGNASFTKILCNTIPSYTQCGVEIFPLDLQLLQSVNRSERKKADRYIKKLCNELKDYDAVNLQLEPSLYGSFPSDIVNRVSRLAKANPHTSVTIHSPRLIRPQQRALIKTALTKIFMLKVLSGLKMLFSSFILDTHIKMNKKIIKKLISYNCRLIAHTLRAKKQIKRIFNYENVDVHPLKFISAGDKIPKGVFCDIKKSLGLADDSIIIGVFGYISKYKGHLDGLYALKHLPEQYKVIFFGRQHPQTIGYEKKDPYLERIYSLVSETYYLRDRVYFMGELNDNDFISVASEIDVVWMPYYENGQDGSGIASICFEVSKRIIASTSFAFDELIKLIAYKNVMRFDIGNYMELAQKTGFIMRQPNLETKDFSDEVYTTKTQAFLYVKEIMPCSP